MSAFSDLQRIVAGSPMRVLGLALVLGTAGACASTPKIGAEPALQAAAQAIANAERAEAAGSAPRELAEARSLLSSAHEAARDKDIQRARRLAQQARVDAELALALHDVTKARSVNAALRGE